MIEVKQESTSKEISFLLFLKFFSICYICSYRFLLSENKVTTEAEVVTTFRDKKQESGSRSVTTTNNQVRGHIITAIMICYNN